MGMMRRRDFLQLGALAALGGISARAQARVKKSAAKARVVIAGGGFAGASCALHLRHLNPALEVVLIDPDESYVTCPMSNEALVGMRTLRSLTISRAGLARAGVRYVRASVVGIDAVQRHVRLDDGSALDYDRLVVAPGIRFLWGTPGGYDAAAAQRMPHAWKAGAQTELLAAKLRSMPDGGVVAISVPSGLIRCPPGPYERASLIAHYLKTHKPRSKVLIFDANNHFPKQDVFTAAWQELYPGMIEWIASTQDGAVVRIDAKKNILYTSAAAHPVAVVNIIPPQAPGMLALDAGLASGHGWCPIKPESFESQLVDHVHVIGDACIADAMPKSASAAVSQARQCALAIVTALEGREPPAPAFDSVCYSLLAPGNALAIHGDFTIANGEIRQVEAESSSSTNLPKATFARQANDWYKNIVAQSFGL